jgi:hypothetical protein
MPESLLVNYIEFANVGHVIEALRYALAYQAAETSRRIGLLLPSKSPWEQATLCPLLDGRIVDRGQVWTFEGLHHAYV